MAVNTKIRGRKRLSSSSPTKKKKTLNKETNNNPLYKPPSIGEIIELKQNKLAYKTDLFRLQLAQLNKDLTPSVGDGKNTVEKFLKSLKSLFDDGFVEKSLKPPFSKKYPTFHFVQEGKTARGFIFPKSGCVRLDVIGGFLLDTTVSFSPTIDILVEMPGDIFQSKDYLNYRYFNKRTAYLAEFKKQFERILKKQENSMPRFELSVEHLHSATYKPILALNFENNGECSLDSLNGWTLRFIPGCEETKFPLSKISPFSNCVRSAFLQSGESKILLPTPTYNALLFEDLVFRRMFRSFRHCAKTCQAFSVSVRLLKLWAKRRNLYEDVESCGYSGGLNGFVLTCIVAHVCRLTIETISNPSSNQLLKLVFSFIKNELAQNNVVTFCPSMSYDNTESMNFTLHIGNAPFHDLGHLNLLWDCHSTALQLEKEADWALRSLEDGEIDAYKGLFESRMRWFFEKDALLTIDIDDVAYDHTNRNTSGFMKATTIPTIGIIGSNSSPIVSRPLKDTNATIDLAELMPQSYHIFSEIQTDARGAELYHKDIAETLIRMIKTATFGLVKDFDIWVRKSKSRLIEQLVVGINFHPTMRSNQHIFRCEDTSVIGKTTFEKMWEGLSDIRRFKDGLVTPCIEFKNEETINENTFSLSVIGKIINHLSSVVLSKIIFENKENIKFRSEYGEGIIGNIQRQTETSQVWNSFNNLKNILSKLRSLPLSIKDIQPLSDDFFFGSSLDLSTFKKPAQLLEIMLEFEFSRSWPSSLAATLFFKRAFFLKMQEELKINFAIDSKLLDENLYLCLGDYPNDFYYKLSIFVPDILEPYAVSLLDFNVLPESDMIKLTKQAQLQGFQDRVEMNYEHYDFENEDKDMVARKAITELFNGWWRSSLAKNFHGLIHKYPSLAEGYLLCNAWASKSILVPRAGYLIKHLVAYIYLHYHKLNAREPPTTPIVCFARFLQLLTTFPWQEQMLIVDFSVFDNPLTEELKNLMQKHYLTRLKNERQEQRHTVPFVTSVFDPHCLFLPSLEPLLFRRLVAGAEQLRCTLNRLSRPKNLDIYSRLVKKILRGNPIENNKSSIFDMEIILNEKFEIPTNKLDGTIFELFGKRRESMILRFVFDTFIRQIRNYLDHDTCVICYDELELLDKGHLPQKIYVKFNPIIFNPKKPAPLKAGLPSLFVTIKNQILSVPCIQALEATFSELGGSLISKVINNLSYEEIII